MALFELPFGFKPHDVPSVFGLALTTAVMVNAWRNRPTRGSYTLAALTASVSVWLVFDILAHFEFQPLKELFFRAQWFGIAPSSFLLFAFVLEYTGREHLLTRRNVALILAFPAAFLVAVWSGAVVTALGIGQPPGIWPAVHANEGPFYWGYIGVAYAVIATSTAMIAVHNYRRQKFFRVQGLAVLVAVLIPWGGSYLAVFDPLGGVGVKFLPLSLGLMSAIFFWATFRAGLGDVMPVAQRTVLTSVSDGILVFDADDRLVEANPTARRLLDLEADPIGTRRSAVYADYPSLRADADRGGSEPADGDGRVTEATGGDGETGEAGDGGGQAVEADDGRTVIEVDTGDDRRIIEVTSTDVTDGRGRRVGDLQLLHDVTEQRHRQRELERQNDRLDQFASLVSHDLRNPVNVAAGNLTVLEEATEDLPPAADRAVGEIDYALDRMDEIIEDVLSMARHGATVEDPGPVELPRVAHAAWKAVDTADCDLVIDVAATVRSEPRRIQQLFENLFRNAVEHGGTDLTVTVGALDDGFFVADDGTGIPPDEREEVLEPGYTTSEDGTGLGLGIVGSIVDAHGWEVRVTESEGGGARFEVTGVEVLDRDASVQSVE